MKLQSVIANVIGAIFIVSCFCIVFDHLIYLNKSIKPNRQVIAREFSEVANAFAGEKTSKVEIFDKKNVYISAGARMRRVEGDVRPGDFEEKMRQSGWRRTAVRFGDVDRYCKGDLVAEITPSNPNGTYALQVNWGNADAACKIK
ncbi:hypothetical protein HF319_01275 [Xanthomonas sp. Kuri4-1]